MLQMPVDIHMPVTHAPLKINVTFDREVELSYFFFNFEEKMKGYKFKG